MTTFEDSILRVLRGDSVVAAAFLVSDRLVATCAHVLQSAGAEVGGKISLQLSNGKRIRAMVAPAFWRNPSAEDVSILKLDSSLENVQHVILGSSLGTKGHSFSTFGFPNTGQELAGGGEIIGQATINGVRVLQLRSSEVTPGFSGAPVFDEVMKRIVGMVLAITPPDEYQRLGTTAFAIPSETIREICPELQISDICPYRSLDVFNEEDAPFFFGRARLVQKMVDSLKREPRFLAVLGPSGSGKSSAVRAGLIPALRQGKAPGSDKWGVITIRPANQPFEQLHSAGLSKSQDGLERAIHSWLETHRENTRLVLVIDQFEEVLVSTPEEIRHTFIREVAGILEAPVALTVVLTLRDDFYSRFSQDAPLLTTWLERGLINLPAALEQDELRLMVMLPAKQVGLSFEDGLVDMILADAAEADRTKGMTRSTILPLLEFALTQVWERRREGRLTHDAYNVVGGVTGGLTQWADHAYHNLTLQEREIARHILSDLVRPGNEAQRIPDTRRTRTLTKLVHRNEVLSQRVIDQLIRVRLLSTWRDEETGLELIEIIHEALLREWGLLQDWLRENQIFLAWQDDFETQIRKWEESEKQEGALLQGLPLNEAEEWLATRGTDISVIGQEFIKAGIALREKERREKERMEQIEAQVRRLTALRAIDSVIASTFNLDLALKIIIDNTLSYLEVDAVGIVLYQPDLQRLEYLADGGFRTPSSSRPPFGIGEGLAGQVIMKRQIHHVTNLQNLSEIQKESLFTEEGFDTYIGVPLISKGIIRGVFEIFHRSSLSPTPDWMEFLETLAGETTVAIETGQLFENLQRSNFELALAYDTSVEGWSRALDLRDSEAEGHTRRVTHMTLRLAHTMGINESALINIRRGALLHDIGKLGIPDAILHKTGRLTDEEEKILQQHPSFAYDLLVPIPFLRPALDIPYCHHEKWDGSGYPRGLKGEEIPLAARIFSIVDAFDTLSTDRPYRRAWQKEEALKHIQEQAGTDFDPKIVEAFLVMMSK